MFIIQKVKVIIKQIRIPLDELSLEKPPLGRSVIKKVHQISPYCDNVVFYLWIVIIVYFAPDYLRILARLFVYFGPDYLL